MLISKNGRKYSKSIPPDLVNEINKRFAEMQKRNRVSITKRFKHGKYNTIYVAILKSNDKHVAIIRTTDFNYQSMNYYCDFVADNRDYPELSKNYKHEENISNNR
jgi:hypothetical protein